MEIRVAKALEKETLSNYFLKLIYYLYLVTKEITWQRLKKLSRKSKSKLRK